MCKITVLQASVYSHPQYVLSHMESDNNLHSSNSCTTYQHLSVVTLLYDYYLQYETFYIQYLEPKTVVQIVRYVTDSGRLMQNTKSACILQHLAFLLQHVYSHAVAYVWHVNLTRVGFGHSQLLLLNRNGTWFVQGSVKQNIKHEISWKLKKPCSKPIPTIDKCCSDTNIKQPGNHSRL